MNTTTQETSAQAAQPAPIQRLQQERWFIERDPRPGMQWSRHVMRDEDNTVCFMCHSDGADDAMDEARALAVAAAPVMLQALQAVVAFIEGQPDATEPFGMVRAAIARATEEKAHG